MQFDPKDAIETDTSSSSHITVPDTEPEDVPVPHRRPTPKGKKLTKWKGKKRQQYADPDEPCHLLNLPPDLLYLVLSRLPPRSLVALSTTCTELYHGLKDDSIWRECYVHRFMDRPTREEVKVLVQGYKNLGGRGWRAEAIGREAMLE